MTVTARSRLQVMYVPVTGPNGEQGFAPVQMQMPQPMPYPNQPAASGSAAAPVQFVEGPNGFFLPVSAAPQAQPTTAPAVSQKAAFEAPATEVEQAGPSAMNGNPFEPQAAVQRRQWPQQIPAMGNAVGSAPAAAAVQVGGSAVEQPAAAAADGAFGVQSSPQKPPLAGSSLESSPGRPGNVSSTFTLSRPDSTNSLGTAGDDGGFQTASTGSLTGQQHCAGGCDLLHDAVMRGERR